MKQFAARAARWWSSRQPRERWMLAAMFLMVGAFVLWYGLLLPLDRLRLASQRDYDQAAAQLQAIQQDLRRPQGTAARQGSVEHIESSAAAAGLALERDAQANGTLSFHLGGARAEDLFDWLNTLGGEGVAPLELHLTRSIDGLEARVVFAGAAP
jgi:type II secretory pathway component PulM